jgi:hypothetical protein
MFLILLVPEVVASLVISWYVVRALSQSIEEILNRITSDQTSRAWAKYVKFAIYVAGVSGGMRITEKDFQEFGMRMMEKSFAEFDSRIYISLVSGLVWKICEAVIGALRGIFWFLACFFIAAAIAFVIVRVIELIKSKPAETQDRA